MTIKKILLLIFFSSQIHSSSFLEKLAKESLPIKAVLATTLTISLSHCFFVNYHLNDKTYHQNQHCEIYNDHYLSSMPFQNIIRVIFAPIMEIKVLFLSKEYSTCQKHNDFKCKEKNCLEEIGTKQHDATCLFYKPIKCEINDCKKKHDCQLHKKYNIILRTYELTFILSELFFVGLLSYILFFKKK